MDSSSQDKNLPATPQRLKKARDDGQVARSKDLSNLVVLGGGMLVLAGLAPTGFARMRDSLAGQLRFDNASVRAPELMLQRLSDNKVVAKRLRMSPVTVCKWRGRFIRERLDGLYDDLLMIQYVVESAHQCVSV